MTTELAELVVQWAEEGLEPAEVIVQLLRRGHDINAALAALRDATSIIEAKQIALAKYMALQAVGCQQRHDY